MTLKELKEKMQNEAVPFRYTKKDGTIRDAIGTTDLHLIRTAFGEEYLPKGTAENIPTDVTRYFDCDVMEWRSFRNELYIED